MPCSGLWVHRVVVQGDPWPATSTEFEPIVAVALAEVHVGYEPAVMSEALLPIDSSGMMLGHLERYPNERLRVDKVVYHDVDFEVLGNRLKKHAVPRSCYAYTQESGDEFVRSYYFNRHPRTQMDESTVTHDNEQNESRGLQLEKIVQIIPASGLWLERIVKDGLALPGPDFTPIIAIALIKIASPSQSFVLPHAVVPITSDDLMRGLIAKSANAGFRVKRKLFHDTDFEELGFRLKPNCVARSFYNFAPADTLDFARHLLERERRTKSEEE